jgi:HAD superfamily phosphatase (TIGR01668 family)
MMPDYMFRTFDEITPEFLTGLGVKAILADIDNTLAPYEQAEPDERIATWLAAVKAAGIQPAFLSNNHGERVELFARTLGVPVQYDAHKPLARRGKKLLKQLGGHKKNAALMGDQIFTDVLCAHFCGIRAILVPPIVDRTDRGTRFKRRMERGILKRYYKKHREATDIRVGSPLTKEHVK